ncbi:hypothetical protein QTO34_016884 [Cnephaeus nilssonii]|uniref:Integral membrane protein 2 n=1 Tax=Cnephaeus nilssonii TaxID=3371016 RepID=A0AA40I322_CNENI|nr:hypothetical protein QTO34_016884 [Eptesicus nilssonii]
MVAPTATRWRHPVPSAPLGQQVPSHSTCLPPESSSLFSPLAIQGRPGVQPDDVYYCGIKYIKDDVILSEPSADAPAARYQTIEENIKIFEEDEVEFISVPVPEFADSDPANIVHDFNKKLTAYLDLNLDKCYVIPLNTSIVMPPRNLLELLINIKAGTYLPQSYLIHEHMVITDRIENIDHLGFFIYRLCHDKETYKLQRRDTIKGIQKREVSNCITIRHFENKFAVETLICS